jgi:hypothetical protein
VTHHERQDVAIGGWQDDEPTTFHTKADHTLICRSNIILEATKAPCKLQMGATQQLFPAGVVVFGNK